VTVRAAPRLAAAAAVAWLASSASGARAQEPTPPPSTAPAQAPDPKLAAAKELFRQGVVLFEAGDVERALELFLRSRAALPAVKNTLNAAICLEKLGRADEAAELYEEVLLRFTSELTDVDRAAVGASLPALRRRIGSLDVSSNVEGTVVIDGRQRGRLPLATPIRLVPGAHVVRVVKDGYVTAEVTVHVSAGVTATADLRLTPLAGAGQLRVEDATNAGADVFVDQVQVGVVPWEGTLGPGDHVVFIRRGDVGTSPIVATVIQGQARALSLHSAPLGPPVHVVATPTTASIDVDGVPLGHGGWQGRLTMGAHRVRASEPGYFDAQRPLFTSQARYATVEIKLDLMVDPRHPRWPRASGHFFAGVFGGYGLGTSPGGGAEAACPSACTGSSGLLGGGGGARVGYRFGNGVGLELAGGYLSLGARFERRLVDTSAAPPVTYDLHDVVALAGPFGWAAATYRVDLGGRFGLTFGAALGLLVATASDRVSGTLSTTMGQTAASLDGAGAPARAPTLLAAPEVRGHVRVGPIELGASAIVPIALLDGPTFPYHDLRPTSACDGHSALLCTKGSAVAASERSFGVFALFWPTVSATWVF
jgi:hypothetical protein